MTHNFKTLNEIDLKTTHLHLLGVICQPVGIAIKALTIDSSNMIFALNAPQDIKYIILMPSKKKKDKTLKNYVLINDDNILVDQTCNEFL